MLFSSQKQDGVALALSQIPSEEKWFLDYFFRQLLLVDGGAYVLHGSKPVALGDFFVPTLENLPFYGNRFFKNEVLMKKGFAVWTKYQHFFPSTNYRILFCEHKEEPLCCLVLINKKNFFKTVADNIDIFQAVLGHEITPSTVYNQLVEGMFLGNSFFEILNNHSGLLGLLLGYEKHNSFLFHQRDLLIGQINNGIIDPSKINLIQDQINQINDRLKVPKRNPSMKLLFSSLPRFVYDSSHEETQKLLQKYRTQRKELTKLYENGDFLEITLKKLISD